MKFWHHEQLISQFSDQLLKQRWSCSISWRARERERESVRASARERVRERARERVRERELERKREREREREHERERERARERARESARESERERERAYSWRICTSIICSLSSYEPLVYLESVQLFTLCMDFSVYQSVYH